MLRPTQVLPLMMVVGRLLVWDRAEEDEEAGIFGLALPFLSFFCCLLLFTGFFFSFSFFFVSLVASLPFSFLCFFLGVFGACLMSSPLRGLSRERSSIAS